jgi:nicastrin
VTTDNFLYVHADQNNDNFGAFLANVLKASGTSSFSVVATSAESNNNNGGFPYPPSPLTSLLSLSAGAAGGAVLTGYDYAFTTHSPYHSHMASSSIHGMNYKSIAAAATIVARAALAAAYDAGDGSYDYETASAYALNLIPNELSYQDETLVALADCLFYNGECDMMKRYATVTSETERSLTGFKLGTGVSLGVPPNYYAGVYNDQYGQPFVQVGDNIYGAYDGQDFGKKSSDAISRQPRALENAIFGMMNDFLGRGTANYAKKSCQTSSDCNDVSFCVNNGDMATCTGGGVCVCRRAHFHAALDEALVPAKNQYTGMFEMNANDANGYSPMYTEPDWSNDVGVRVYRDAGTIPGLVTLAAGAVVSGLSFCAAFVLRVGLKKEKLY